MDRKQIGEEYAARSEVPRPIKNRRGSLKVANLGGAPVFVHWSFGAGGLVLAAISGFQLPDSVYYCLAFGALILVHEAGHFVAAKCLGLKVISVDLSGISGQCEVQAPRGVLDTFILFSAGLWIQLVLLIAALYFFGFDAPTSTLGKCLMYTFMYVNLYLIVFNALPLKLSDGLATDGFVLYTLFLHVTKGGPHPFPLAQTFSTTRYHDPDAGLLAVEGLAPPDFSTGVEIFNDATTPMEFVVDLLGRHFDMDRAKTIEIMLDIHRNGGALLPVADMELAETIAAAMTQEVRAHGHQLLCRAASREARPEQTA